MAPSLPTSLEIPIPLIKFAGHGNALSPLHLHPFPTPGLLFLRSYAMGNGESGGWDISCSACLRQDS